MYIYSRQMTTRCSSHIPKSAVEYKSRKPIKYTMTPQGPVINLPERDKNMADYVIELQYDKNLPYNK